MMERAWEYKDASRDYWTVTIASTAQGRNWLWRVRVYCSPTRFVRESVDCVFDGEMEGQADEMPTLNECLIMFQNYINGVVIGLAAHGK